MKKKLKAMIKVGQDKVAAKILRRYAFWHRNIGKKELCGPCNHCNNGDHCQPCGTTET